MMNLTPIRFVMEKYTRDDAKRIKEVIDAIIDELRATEIVNNHDIEIGILIDLLTIMWLVPDIIEEEGQ